MKNCRPSKDGPKKLESQSGASQDAAQLFTSNRNQPVQGVKLGKPDKCWLWGLLIRYDQ